MPNAQQSESFKVPKSVQLKIQIGSFKVPKPVQQIQVMSAQSSEQDRLTKAMRRDLSQDVTQSFSKRSNEQTKIIEAGHSTLDRSIAGPRNDNITKEDRDIMRKQILRSASDDVKHLSEQTKLKNGGIKTNKIIIIEDRNAARRTNQSSEVKGDDLARMIAAELDKIPSRSPSPVRNQESLNYDGPSKSTRASVSRTGQIGNIGANTRSRSATKQNTSDSATSGTIQLNTRRATTRNAVSKRKELSIPPIPPLEGLKPKKPVEVAANKAKPIFYDGGFSTGPIEIKPLPSWCDVKPKHPKPLPPKLEENEQDGSRVDEGNEHTEKTIQTKEEENKEVIQHLEHEIMKFMVEKAAKEEAKKLAAKKRQEEEQRKAEEERQKREEEGRRREFLNKCRIEARELRMREVSWIKVYLFIYLFFWY
jgi:hypothetical protein